MKSISFLIACAISLIGCSQETKESHKPKDTNIEGVPGSIGITGDTLDVKVEGLIGGIVLMGGSTDVDEAMIWMAERAKGGDFVILRASGSVGYNDYLYELSNLNSVETLLINSREIAENEQTAQRIREAEGLFIAGGDQANYVNFWKGTKTADALNYLVNEKKAVIGGTSAGCAILGELIYSATNGTITSEIALNNPYDSRITIDKGGFIKLPILTGVITDQHYSQRIRNGRHVVFLAYANEQFEMLSKGIGVDERTALCIDENGIGRVFGSHSVYFLWSGKEKPEVMEPQTPLTWNANGQAVIVHVLSGSVIGENYFDLTDWENGNHAEGIRGFYYVDAGALKLSNR